MAHTFAEMDVETYIVREPRRLGGAAKERILAFIEEAQNVNCEKGLKQLFHGRVNELIPHQIAAFGIGDRGKLWMRSTINIGFPESYLRNVIIDNRVIVSPVIKAWAENPVVQIFNDLMPMKKQNPRWGEVVEHHGIRNMIVHGLPDIGGENSSYFCLAKCPGPITEEQGYLMELITPHLHKALLCAINTKATGHQSEHRLTAREHEVLRAMCRGYANKEI
ncbi:hypothetical protein MNBD_GAMMA20-1171, partial [hydrothermal vent metagenome]